MKQLTCILCGSTEMQKEGETFVCISCGAKYSIDEAMKIMKEVSKNNDNAEKNAEIEKKLQNAINEFNNANNESAYSICLDILNVDPKNYRAIIFKGLAEGWQSTVETPKIAVAASELMRAVEIIKETTENDKDFTEKCIEPLEQMAKLGKALLDLYLKYHNNRISFGNKYMSEANSYYSKANAEWDLTISRMYRKSGDNYAEQARSIEREAESVLRKGASIVALQMNNLAITIINNIEEQQNASGNFFIALLEYMKTYRSYFDDIDKSILDQTSTITNYMQVGLEASLERTIREYWEEHKEEKEALEEEKDRLEIEIGEIAKKIKENDDQIKTIKRKENVSLNIDNKIELENGEVTKLQTELSALGIFSFKEKKALKEKISEKQTKIYELRKSSEAQHEDIRKKCNEEAKPFEKENDELQGRLDVAQKRIKEIEETIKNPPI